ncbi:MAG TPA: transcription elongation factor GreAB [Kiritimatiellia bacterium]|nr:transcription elongation factor GreAB [Kiritimatiellia bacterium]
MNKIKLIEAIIVELHGKVSMHMSAAKAAHEEATHEENVAEDKYDTRGLEASYLAAGQAKQTVEMAAAVHDYSSLFVKKFTEKDPIDVSALVELKSGKEKQLYFIGPSAGGLEVEFEGRTVLILTPQSPLGGQMMGRKKGDKLKIKIAGMVSDYQVMSVT